MKPVIVGCRTADFTPEQLRVFAEHQPMGMIVFAEPCREGPDAVRHVVAQFKSAVPQGKIFIDAEGGRVGAQCGQDFGAASVEGLDSAMAGAQCHLRAVLLSC